MYGKKSVANYTFFKGNDMILWSRGCIENNCYSTYRKFRKCVLWGVRNLLYIPAMSVFCEKRPEK